MTSTHPHDAYECGDCMEMQTRLRENIKGAIDKAIKEFSDNPTERDKALIRGLELAKSVVDYAATV